MKFGKMLIAIISMVLAPMLVFSASAHAEPVNDDADEIARLIAMDPMQASDEELLELGFTARRDVNGQPVEFIMTDETQAFMEKEGVLLKEKSEGPQVASVVEWAKCAGGIGVFILTTVYPAGKLGAIAVRTIGIIKRVGVKKTVDILKRFAAGKGYGDHKAFIKDFAAAAFGISSLAPCVNVIPGLKGIL